MAVAAVAAGAAHLLVVGFDRARRREMDHGPHVGPVDPHPEGVGGDHHLRLAPGKGALDRRARPIAAQVSSGAGCPGPRRDGSDLGADRPGAGAV